MSTHILSSRNGRLTSNAEFIDRVFDELDKLASTTLVIHFSDVLVSHSESVRIAERLDPTYRSAGTLPIFFLCESGFLDFITHNLSEIWGEQIFQTLRLKVHQLILGKQSQSAAGRPLDEVIVLDELRKEHPYANHSINRDDNAVTLTLFEEEDVKSFIDEDAALKHLFSQVLPSDWSTETASQRVTEPTLLSSFVLNDLAGHQVRPTGLGNGIAIHVLKVMNAVLRRFKDQRDHGIYATVVEEILRQFYMNSAGYGIWHHLKKNTADAFGDHEDCVGTALLNKLCALSETGRKTRLVLVGHGAGAVYINHFLQHAGKKLPRDVTFDVIFLAAACTFDAFCETVMEHEDRIASIRCFGLSDNLEQKDRLIDFLPQFYPHSILYFISGLLENRPDNPLLGMQRYHSNSLYDSIPTVRNVRAFFRQDALVWAPANHGSGRATSAQKHASFPDDEETLNSIRYILAGR